MAYQSKYKGKVVEDILDNSLLKKEQSLTDNEKNVVKKNLGIEIPDLSEYATKKDVEDAIGGIPTPDVGGQIAAALVDYVKKVEGKGLSTNDFTNELKKKLEGITPYDPSGLEAEISKLDTALNTLVSGNASNAIESFNEIVAFLDGISDSEDLDSIIASIEHQIASKYSKPFSGIPKSDLANDVQKSLDKANTALQEHQSLSDYATKDELNKKAEGSIETLDNGNIKVTINGVSKDFMPATPSGDPMHHYYESLGAQWNDGEDKTLQIPIYGKDKATIEYMSVVHKSKRWYLNLLGNITNAQMANIVSYPRNLNTENAYNSCKARTVIFEGNGLSSAVSYKNFCVRANIESLYVKQAMYPSDVTKMFYAAYYFKYMLGDPSINGYVIGYNGFGSNSESNTALVEIRILNLRKNALFPNSSALSKTSVLFMVNEATPTTAIVIALHPTAYARIANDEEVIAALEAKNAALQGTGGSVSIVSA